jgi:hypothetical protein
MASLGEADRNFIALRFFEDRSWREVAELMRVKEDAAQKRVMRALEKLRVRFARRGVTLSVALIAGAVSAHSVHAAPVGLAKTISAAALVKGTATGGSTLTLVKGVLKVMAWTKAKTAIAAGVAAVVLATGSATVATHQVKRHRESAIVNAFIGKYDETFSKEDDPEFQKVRALGADAVPYLVAAIEKYNSVRDKSGGHPDRGNINIRVRAYWGLEGLGPVAKPAIPFLIEQFSASNDLIDFDYHVLAGFGPDAKEAIPVLIEAFHGGHRQLRFYAARALAKIDPDYPELLPRMLADLKNRDAVTRRFACITLGEMGPKAATAVPALKEMLRDEDQAVRERATEALQAINAPTN